VAACDNGEKQEEGKKIVAELAKLKYEVQHDRALTYAPPRRSCHAVNILRNDETGPFETMDTRTSQDTTKSSSSWETSPG
jgi:hypothetical protein